MARVSAALWFSLAACLAAQDTGVVEGRLTNSVTHAGISGGHVKLTKVGAETEFKTISDRDGAFRIANLPRDEYLASYDARGFGDPLPGDPASRPFTTRPGSAPVRLEAKLILLGKISGRVLDMEGRPQVGALYQLMGYYGNGGTIGNADAAGRFEIPWITPGVYVLSARPVGAEPTGLAPTYFPGGLTRQESEPIHVHSGAELSGYDIRLRRVPVRKVSGVVLDPAGKPMPGISVTIPGSNPFVGPDAQVVTRPDGTFEFPALRAGTWYLAAAADNDEKWYGSARITVDRSSVESVRIRLMPRLTVTGRVEREDSRAERGEVSVFLEPAGWNSWERVGAAGKPDGALRIPNVAPGRYRIQPIGTVPNHYLESILLGTEDVLGREVELGEGALPLRVIYKANPATARGTVEKGEGSTVVLIPRDPALIDRYSVKTTRCDSNGRFEVAGLRPGSYYAFAFDRVSPRGETYNAAFIRLLAPQATSVELRKGEPTSVDLKVTPWPH